MSIKQTGLEIEDEADVAAEPLVGSIPSAVSKRVFDLTMVLATAVFWLPLIGLCALANAVMAGFPVFYVSRRRVGRDKVTRVVKFRTMVRNADRVFNRDTVPVSGNVRFLNTPPDSPLYTRIGRFIERCALTEIPQFLMVLRGDMSLIGNRPLPDNVMDSLREVYHAVDDRFLTPAGMTGPVQLIGRAEITDLQRLRLEADYCRIAIATGSWLLDLTILVYTVLISTRLMRARTIDEVYSIMARFAPRGSEDRQRP